MSEWSLTARWVFPVDQPPLERGCVTIAGEKIVAVQPRGQRTADVDLGNVAVLPGLVNAHTHLDLTGLRSLTPPSPADFTGWLRQVIAHRRRRSPQQIQADVRAGLAECLRYGTTLVGDISGDGSSWDVLADAPVRAVVYRELLGLPEERAARAWSEAQQWLSNHPATDTCRPGLSPHAPYSVRASLFQAVARVARAVNLPVAIHIAEHPAELFLLGDRSGPFVEFLTELGVYDAGGLIEHWEALLETFRGLPNAAFIHANYLGLLASPASIHAALRVVCPRTRAAFGFGGGPVRELGQPGVRLALGTDSLASNPDLDILAEARFLHRQHPEVAGAGLLRLATLAGAEALGWEHETGSLTPGKSADLVVLPLPGEDSADPHRLVLESAEPVQRVLWRGRWIESGSGG
jgi:cytosine/adenosine deaminase-related metal-dependent hydrolase